MTRIEAAKRRAAGAKRAVGAASAAGFVALLILARVSHPGHATTTHAASVLSSSTPSQQVQVQTHVS